MCCKSKAGVSQHCKNILHFSQIVFNYFRLFLISLTVLEKLQK